MDFTEVTNYFTSNNFGLKYLGVYLVDSSNLPIWYKLYWFTLHIIFMGIFNSLLIINWVLNSTTVKGFASCGYIITACIMGQVKLIVLLNNKKLLVELIKQFNLKHFCPRNLEEWDIVHKELLFWKKAKRLLVFTSFFSVFSLISTPFFDTKHNRLPVPAWYPVNISVPSNYKVAVAHQDVAIFLIGFGYTFAVVMFSGVLTYTGLQCELLSLRIQRVIEENGSSQEAHRILVDCVSHHWEIIKFLRTTNKLFGKIYFWQLFASILTLCMALFLIKVTDPNTFEFFYYIVYFIALSNLLLVPCWFASEMTRKSQKIFISAYKCNWMDATNSFKKELQFFILRTQRPMKVYAADFFEISVETFVKIVRASLSYFAVLNSLNTEKDHIMDSNL